MDKVLSVLSHQGIEATWHKRDEPLASGDVSIPLGDGGALCLRNIDDTKRALAILAGYISGELYKPTRESVMLRMLQGTYDPNDPACFVQGLERDVPCCAIVMQSRDELTALRRALDELFPPDGSDIVVATVGGQYTVIKQMQNMRENDIVELCLALQDTLRQESGAHVAIGIGNPRSTYLSIDESYDEAVSAIRVGMRYYPTRQVYIYRKLIIERFLQELPENTRNRYHQMLFNACNNRLFNSEMCQTVDCFFECNLNLSEAARRLFIHRNTLVYRLDKLQKAVGLDLRKFDDAVVYKFLYMMGESFDERRK